VDLQPDDVLVKAMKRSVDEVVRDLEASGVLRKDSS
jgi:hypothetical protein